jgi:hypothetical protein
LNRGVSSVSVKIFHLVVADAAAQAGPAFRLRGAGGGVVGAVYK